MTFRYLPKATLTFVLAQYDFDVGPNMALILANVDPNKAFILTQDDSLLGSHSHVDLRLDPT